MKKKKNQAYVMLFGVFVVVMVAFLVIAKYTFANRKSINTVDPGKYYANITIETSSSLKGSNTRSVSLKDDGNGIVVKTNYLNSPLYILENDIYTSYGGRYQMVSRDYTYKDLYVLLYNLDFPKEDGNYNPRMERDEANKVLSSLLINSSLEKEAYANISLKDGKLKKFSIYLSNIENFTKLNISITFDYLDDDFENVMPIFYDEVIDKMDDAQILISD